MRNKQLWTAIVTLTGTVIGAGFLGIPYVVAKSGFLIGLFWMVAICLIMLLVNLILGEIILSSKTVHQLPGFASKYLGKKTKLYVLLTLMISVYSALIAYLIGVGQSLSFIFFNSSNYTIIAGLIFWFVMILITYEGLRGFKKIEPLGVITIFIVVFIFWVLNFSKINFSNFLQYNTSYLFLPFGVILFAFLGLPSIPEMRRILEKDKKLMKKSIIIGSLIPLFVYLLFTLIVLGLYDNVPEIATLAFGKIVTLLGIFTMLTSYLALSLALQDTFRFDFNFSFKKAWLFTAFLPLIVFLLVRFFNLAGFVKVLSLGGSLAGGLLSIAMLLIHEKIQEEKRERNPEYKVRLPLMLKIVFILLFVAGIIYEFL